MQLVIFKYLKERARDRTKCTDPFTEKNILEILNLDINNAS